MSGRLGKSGLSPGTSWHLFAENIAFEEDENPSGRGSQETSETTRLHKEDMRMFGECPSQDSLSLVICKQCQKILLPSAVLKHYELRHPKALSSVVSSKKITQPLGSPTSSSYSRSKLLKSSDNNFIRIEEVDPMDINVKIEEVPLTMPKLNNAGKIKLPKVNIKKLTGVGKGKDEQLSDGKVTVQSKLQQKKATGMKDKEYNPDRHCGVWIADQHRRCTRSLTCKTHSLSLRRLVTGRKRPFDVLLSEHKTRVQGGPKDDHATANGAMQSNNSHMKNGIASATSHSTTLASPSLRHQTSNSCNKYQQGDHSFLSTISSHVQQTCHFQAQLIGFMNDDVIGSVNLPTVPHHPRPMRVNRFGARASAGGAFTFHRKLDRFHVAAMSLAGLHNPQTLDKNNGLSANSLSSLLSAEVQVMDDNNVWGLTNGRIPSTSHAFPGRLKGKAGVNGGHKQLTGIKRQTSLNISAKAGHLGSQSVIPSKRRHSIDAPTDEFKPLDASYSSNVKPLNDLGQVVASIDNISTPVGTVSPEVSSISTLTVGTLSLSNPMRGDTMLAATNLNSSLNLCQTLEMTGVMPPVMNPATVGNVTFATRLPTRTFTNAQQQQQQQTVKATVKDILPRPMHQQALVNSSGTNLIQGCAPGATIASNGYVYQAFPFNDKGNHVLPAAHQQLVVTSLPLAAAHSVTIKTEASRLNNNSSNSMDSSNSSSRASVRGFANQVVATNVGSNSATPRSHSPASSARFKQINSVSAGDGLVLGGVEASITGRLPDSSVRGGVTGLVAARQPDASMVNLTPS